MRTALPKSARTSARQREIIAIATALTLGGSVWFGWGGPTNQIDQARTASSVPWQENQIITPTALVKVLSADNSEKPLVLCVGFPVLYQGGHIVGAKFAGPASRSAGIQALKHAVQNLPRDKHIVLYCGCCPWNRCPNIRPAFSTVQELGFTNVQVLSLPTNFREDWIAKGFPIEKGSARQ